MSRWVPETSPDVAARYHHMAHAAPGWPTSPGYVRADRRLQAATKAERRAPDAWFEARWRAGDAAACAAEAERLVASVAGYPDGGLLPPDRIALIVVPALQPTALPLDDRPGPAVAAGFRCPPVLLVLAAVAIPVAADPRWADVDLSDEDRLVACHFIAGGHVAAALAGDDPNLDRLLTDATRALLPPDHQADRLGDRIARFVRAGLVRQPPGEIERLTRGLQRRRSDRLHRAWNRNFFALPDTPAP